MPAGPPVKYGDLGKRRYHSMAAWLLNNSSGSK
jgi:hypothetical protein